MRDASPRRDDGVSYRAVAIAGGLIALAIGTALVSAFLLLRGARDNPEAPTSARPGAALGTASGPALQASPARDIAEFRTEKERRLDAYGWVDRAHGVVHIPIARAMEILVARSTGGAR